MVGGGQQGGGFDLHGQILFARDGPTKKHLSGKNEHRGLCLTFRLQAAGSLPSCSCCHYYVGLTFFSGDAHT